MITNTNNKGQRWRNEKKRWI